MLRHLSVEVPEPDSRVTAAAGQLLAIGAELDLQYAMMTDGEGLILNYRRKQEQLTSVIR